MIDVLQQYDVPLRFLSAFARYARENRLVGAEFKSRVRTLDNFKACLAAIDKTHTCLPPNALQFTDAP